MSMIPQPIDDLICNVIREDEGGWVFTDRPDDAGGPTFAGMTWRTFNRWQSKRPSTYLWTKETFMQAAKAGEEDDPEPDLQESVIECYYDEFYLGCHVGECPIFVQEVFFSACINMGRKEATKALQIAHNDMLMDVQVGTLKVDGWWGPKTKRGLELIADSVAEAYLDGDGQDDVVNRKFKLYFSDACIQRYIRLVQRNAREWEKAARSNFGRSEDHTKLPDVLQSENLMGWFNRAVSYRNR